MSRWKNIRDNFCRSEKQRTKLGRARGRTVGRYIYARYLSFLQDANKTVAATSSPDEEATVTENLNSNASSEVERDSTFEEPLKKRFRHKAEDESINFTSSFVPSTCSEVSKDKLYLESLLPLIEDFTVDQNIEFRLGVLNLIKKIRNSP